MSEFQLAAFNEGDVIFKMGDDADTFYVVQEGVVTLTDGLGKAFAKIGAGDSFGEQALLTGGIRGATAHARTQVKCVCITTDRMVAYLRSGSPLLTSALESLLLELSMKNSLQEQAQSLNQEEASH